MILLPQDATFDGIESIGIGIGIDDDEDDEREKERTLLNLIDILPAVLAMIWSVDCCRNKLLSVEATDNT